jgi:hypothetical protein
MIYYILNPKLLGMQLLGLILFAELNMALSISDEKLKEIMKEAVIEIIKEKRKVFYEILLEAIEEVGLANAIREGRKNKFVGEDRILKMLG